MDINEGRLSSKRKPDRKSTREGTQTEWTSMNVSLIVTNGPSIWLEWGR